ncbi:MAG: TRAM domain-containing protein [bacterium]
MFFWILRLIVVIAGPIIGYYVTKPSSTGVLIGVGIAAVVIIIEMIVERVPLDNIIAGTLGIIVGVISGKLLDYTIFLMKNEAVYEFYKPYSFYVQIVFAYIGLMIAIRKKGELSLLDRNIPIGAKAAAWQGYKILDTSAVIDGRIAEICETKFLEGTMIVPRFVLKELQGIADSFDTMKRNRGRRGLDILAKLQENKYIQVKIYERDFPELEDVDVKLVKLATELKARILTTDFNLNKVAALQGVEVLNVNELSNAVKPLVLPGEAMHVLIVKEGKEHNQGVAYLDDGTMVVVEDGRKLIGRKVDVAVTSVLQTTAGRMIFAQPKLD